MWAGAMLAGLLALRLMSGTALSVAANPEEAAGWELKGSRIIGCCCTSPCPCRLNKKPLHSPGCDATTAVHIEQGHLGKTTMDGVDFIVVGRGFSKEIPTNWAYVYVSDKVTDEQYRALEAFFKETRAAMGSKARPCSASSWACARCR